MATKAEQVKTPAGSELVKAVISVMKEVKGIDKAMTIGQGNSAYKGVADKDVKEKIGDAMAKHGLTIFPTGIEPVVTTTRWDETYNGQTKPKQSVFTEVKTRYLLMHESGESIELEGYGHGIDTQDKSAGKAATYALKYTLLYTFMVATGKIDDSDNSHSDEGDKVLAAQAEAARLAEIERVEKLKTAATEALKSFTKTEDFAGFKEAHAEALKHKDIHDFSALCFSQVKKAQDKLESNPAGMLKKPQDDPNEPLHEEEGTSVGEMLNAIRDPEPVTEIQSMADEAIEMILRYTDKKELSTWALKKVKELEKAKEPLAKITEFKDKVNTAAAAAAL